MKMHKSLSNILVILCGQGLCWPLWAIMLLPSVAGVQSSFHQGKSLSCVTMPQYTSHLIYCVRSLLMPTRTFLGRLVTRALLWSCQRPLPLSVRPLCSGLMRVDDSVPIRGPVTLTRMRGAVNKTMQWCIGGVKGHVWSGEGPLPSSSHQHRHTSGKLLWSRDGGDRGERGRAEGGAQAFNRIPKHYADIGKQCIQRCFIWHGVDRSFASLDFCK